MRLLILFPSIMMLSVVFVWLYIVQARRATAVVPAYVSNFSRNIPFPEEQEDLSW